jgi:hypothetical protein
MPIRKPWDHATDLKETFKPKKGRLIPLSPEEQKEVSDFIDDQLSKKYIRPAKSEQTSPVFFAPKKDGRKRMVQDYRYLNEHTVKNNYPLPLISQLVDKLKGSKWFTKIDLHWGYNNVRIKEGDAWKAAFVKRPTLTKSARSQVVTMEGIWWLVELLGKLREDKTEVLWRSIEVLYTIQGFGYVSTRSYDILCYMTCP